MKSKELNRCLKLTEVLRKQHSDFPPNGLAIFVCIAQEEGLSASDLINKLNIPKATVSRNLRLLGETLSPTKKGMNLIKLVHDPKDYRVRRGYLTDAGRAFLEEITEAMA